MQTVDILMTFVESTWHMIYVNKKSAKKKFFGKLQILVTQTILFHWSMHEHKIQECDFSFMSTDPL